MKKRNENIQEDKQRKCENTITLDIDSYRIHPRPTQSDEVFCGEMDKVIDPLFLDDLKNELREIQQITVQRTRDKKLRDFQMKLSNLRWLDPASGSGNFLTETYISIRWLENIVIKELQMMKETEDIVHMNLEFLPLTTNAFIVEGNSLQIDWDSVIPKNQVSYIMGNPPFHGFTFMTVEQK